MTGINQIERIVQGMFARRVRVAVTPLHRLPPPLFPAEAAAMRGAVPARRHEFALGRGTARAAMQALGLRACAIPMADDRAPVWPEGIAGSISHGGGLCLSVVSADPGLAAIGIDVDSAAALPDDLWEVVCDASERAWLASQPVHDQGRLAKLIFCAKEAAYKAQYPLTKRLFGFDGFHISVDLQAARFDARFTAGVAPFRSGEALSGRFHLADSHIICAVTVANTCRADPDFNEMVA
ncbi:4'-phosphopantetheinyl transferase family protein [Roseicitreum antarcticum]|uniref:Enterobactin synthase component D n=1 Tax=Roseicitreum antarcticum TaxID=564137 RepID=A0A1H2RYE7_9RHOB|nr:4'-phosphopantetheinyl transferase superfamily protein [Roseicitreum antarcticum]SDW24512.1 4'-phosphopantetheinyl transferase EntD (siderophore biosynthesis) [Roseicitreum antarcticum]